MADWCQLPRELIDLISKHLITETDLLRFRSVCTSWRSSIPPFTFRFNMLPNTGISETQWGLYLSKRTVFRIALPDNNNSQFPWLIKIEKDHPQKTHLMNPLTGSESIPLPLNFPRLLNVLHLRVTELCQEYALQCVNFRPNANSVGDSGTLYMEKVAFCNVGRDGFVVLTIHVSGKLVIFKSGEKKWDLINDMPSPYDDVIFYDGKFYGVDTTGRTVVIVDLETYSLKVVADSVFGGDKKFLVENDGELFLVDKYLSVAPENDDENDDGNDDENDDGIDDGNDEFLGERTVKLKVFKLDFEELKWVEVENLGDRMLFVGDNCGFSASASEFPGCKGNCVFFTGESSLDEGSTKARGVGVFDLEKGNIGAVPNNSGYSQLFWPPPSWLHSNLVALENGLDHLNV